MAAPKTTFTVTYRKAGTQPPIFVAGEFSEPAWQPQEMDFTTDEDGEHTFKKDIQAYAGSRVQYKFRVGLGDWWVLNEDAPTAKDAAGIFNNVAEVPLPVDQSESTVASTPKKDIVDNSSRPAHEEAGTSQKTTTEGSFELQTESKPRAADAPKGVINPQVVEAVSDKEARAIADTATEVADTAALLDDDADMPSHSEAPTAAASIEQSPTGTEKDTEPTETKDKDETQSAPDEEANTTAQVADEVADSAAKLDEDVDVPAHGHGGPSGAVKEDLKHVEAQPASNISTPAKTADEVADSAAKLDTDVAVPAHGHGEPSESTKEILEEAGPQSAPGISTPAKTADEVADSAATLDEDVEVPAHGHGEPSDATKATLNDKNTIESIPDNTTPAQTAAEVAETAAKLDKDVEVPAHGHGEPSDSMKAAVRQTETESDLDISAPAQTAAEVAETAARLDTDVKVPALGHGAPSDATIATLNDGTGAKSTSDNSAPAETAAEVAETAAHLDNGVNVPAHGHGEPSDTIKAILSSKNPQATYEASTSGSVDTAVEGADAVTVEDKNATLETEPQVANTAKELMSRLNPESRSGSGASTPSFVRTAAEVADSAALLDKEASDEEIPDEQAGRIGYRRMSTTPIPEVAVTAAEVADVARSLDEETIEEFELRPEVYEGEESYDFQEPYVSDTKAPLFAHECIGMELSEEEHAAETAVDDHDNDIYNDDEHSPGHGSEYDPDKIDFNDPTLERFPSNREEIIDAVRKLEGGLNEDRSDVEGLVPPSPIVGPSGPQNHDTVGDILVSSPVVLPAMGRGSRLLGLPGRTSMGSVSSDRLSLSAASLGSISEAEEEAAIDDEDEAPVPVIMTPKPGLRSSNDNAKSPTSDGDGGIVMVKSTHAKARGGSPVNDTAVQEQSADRTLSEAAEANPIESTSGASSPAAEHSTKLEEMSDNSGSKTPSIPAPESAKDKKKRRNDKYQKRGGKHDERGHERRSPSARADRSQRSEVANAWAAAVQQKDVETNKELMAHRKTQDEALRAQGLGVEDVQSPIKDTWRPTNLDEEGKRKNEKIQVAHHAPGKSVGQDAPAEGEGAASASGPPTAEHTSPCFVAQTAQEMKTPLAVSETGESRGTSQSSAADDTAAKAAQSSGVDTGANSQVKKRTTGRERSATPASIDIPGIQTAKNKGWVRSFFKMVFVDFLGSIFRRLFGNKRET